MRRSIRQSTKKVYFEQAASITIECPEDKAAPVVLTIGYPAEMQLQPQRVVLSAKQAEVAGEVLFENYRDSTVPKLGGV